MAKKEFDLDNLWNLGKRLGGQTDSRSDASPAGSGSRSNDIETDWEDDSSLTVGGDLTEGGGSDAFEGTEAAGDGDAEDLPEENTIRITMLGVSMSGKTSFLSGVYQTMMVDSFQGLSLVSSVGGEEDYEMISEIADIALINRDGFEFPAGTDRTTVFPLMLQKGSRDICRFEFTDYRGGDIEEILKKHSEYMESARDIRNRLVKSDAILIFADAVELSLRRARASYRLAAPAYDPADDTVKLLLPLCLVDDRRVDCAAVLTLMPSGTYQVTSVLSLERAYACARVISADQPSWLPKP